MSGCNNVAAHGQGSRAPQGSTASRGEAAAWHQRSRGTSRRTARRSRANGVKSANYAHTIRAACFRRGSLSSTASALATSGGSAYFTTPGGEAFRSSLRASGSRSRGGACKSYTWTPGDVKNEAKAPSLCFLFAYFLDRAATFRRVGVHAAHAWYR